MAEHSDTETEYMRASECQRVITKTNTFVNDIRNDLINERKRNIALTTVTKELSSKYKNTSLELTLAKQELEHYKNKVNRVPSKTMSEATMLKLFDKKDDYILRESQKGVDELVEQLRKEYL